MAKMIDQKGRLFGLINVIDLSVIVVLICLVPLIIYGYKTVVLGENVRSQKWVSIKVRFAETEPEFSSIIQKGDCEKDANGNVIARLTAVTIKPQKVWAAIDDKTLKIVDHPDRKDIVADMDVLCLEKRGGLYCKSYPIKIGQKISFSTELYDVVGPIIYVKRMDNK